jgi:hypothetical protein
LKNFESSELKVQQDVRTKGSAVNKTNKTLGQTSATCRELTPAFGTQIPRPCTMSPWGCGCKMTHSSISGSASG